MARRAKGAVPIDWGRRPPLRPPRGPVVSTGIGGPERNARNSACPHVYWTSMAQSRGDGSVSSVCFQLGNRESMSVKVNVNGLKNPFQSHQPPAQSNSSISKTLLETPVSLEPSYLAQNISLHPSQKRISNSSSFLMSVQTGPGTMARRAKGAILIDWGRRPPLRPPRGPVVSSAFNCPRHPLLIKQCAFHAVNSFRIALEAVLLSAVLRMLAHTSIGRRWPNERGMALSLVSVSSRGNRESSMACLLKLYRDCEKRYFCLWFDQEILGMLALFWL
ncbi:hypothetical protein CEXT_156541 [Caerostris extrusa]|uniref:Uncharacterized protein n=1 Tax=Caerostris extrusa TaxID=172846 RepID=A0AAV4TW29_CAEEX|nr:hypothetical protein CEXT_156541 [Caerostris extrusa]